jgi:hypothetical protein
MYWPLLIDGFDGFWKSVEFACCFVFVLSTRERLPEAT